MAAGGPRDRARSQVADKRLSQESGVSPRERLSQSIIQPGLALAAWLSLFTKGPEP